jgi:hypothetical protein
MKNIINFTLSVNPVVPTVIVASVIGVLLAAVVIKGIIDKKRGKHSCSCGGNCGACGACKYKPESKK